MYTVQYIDRIQRQHSGLYSYWQDTAAALGTLHSTVYRYWHDTAAAFGTLDRIQLQHSGLYRYCQDTAPAFGTLQVLPGYSSSIRDSTVYRYWQDTAPASGTLQVQYWQDTAPAFGTLQVLPGYCSSSIRDPTGIDRIQLPVVPDCYMTPIPKFHFEILNLNWRRASENLTVILKAENVFAFFWRLFCEIKNDIFEIFIIKSSFWFFEI